ncbi:hypothetical protein NQ080_13940, partial [Enterococcus faecium]|uniref:hypothetical protein n=1 Tax=Enterococcus faecium TaxID=1352 RepID=UPI00215D3770
NLRRACLLLMWCLLLVFLQAEYGFLFAQFFFFKQKTAYEIHERLVGSVATIFPYPPGIMLLP